VKQLDYIIVGLGIGGLSFCEQLRLKQKRFIVIDGSRNPATAVAGGVINPVVLKRFTPVWNAQEFLPAALSFYHRLAAFLKIELINEAPILRTFNSVEEQNDWTVASDKQQLSGLIAPEIHPNSNEHLNAPFGFGRVIKSYRLQTNAMLHAYTDYLKSTDQYISEEFDHAQLIESGAGVSYKNYSARKIVFTEGISALQNPLFPGHLLIPNKGEYISLKAPELQLKQIVKGAVFLIPLENDLYKAGATFSRNDTSEEITDSARETIVGQLKKVLNCPFTVIDQISGIRPTTKDRRPLLGTISNPDIAFLNGLGARGLMMAPLLAEQLYTHLEEGQELPQEINISRFL
jgi:glycine oxidase